MRSQHYQQLLNERRWRVIVGSRDAQSGATKVSGFNSRFHVRLIIPGDCRQSVAAAADIDNADWLPPAA
jgi:hypothetical protein